MALNPVRARLVERAADWRWSGLQARLDPARGDGPARTEPVLSRYPDFAAKVADGEDEARTLAPRRAETIGRPVGEAVFLQDLERRSGRSLSPAKRGRKPKQNQVDCHRFPFRRFSWRGEGRGRQ